MFEIKYQIPDRIRKALKDIDVNVFDLQYHEVHGPIELHFNGKQYGLLAEESYDLPMMDELLCYWFELLNKVTLKLLESEDYVALKVFEVPFSWFEFLNEGDNVLIRKVEDTVSLRMPNDIITQPIPEFYSKWDRHEVINKRQYVEEVIKKTDDFLNDVHCINESLLESKFIRPLVYIHNKVVQSAKFMGVELRHC